MADYDEVVEIPLDSPPLRRFAVKPPKIHFKTAIRVLPKLPCWFVTENWGATFPYVLLTTATFPGGDDNGTLERESELNCDASYPNYVSAATQWGGTRFQAEALNRRRFTLSDDLTSLITAPRVPDQYAATADTQPTFEFAGADITLWQRILLNVGSNSYWETTGATIVRTFPAKTYFNGEIDTIVHGNIYTDPDTYWESHTTFRGALGFAAMTSIPGGGAQRWVTDVNPLQPVGPLSFTSVGWEIPTTLGVVKYDMTKVTRFGTTSSSYLRTLANEDYETNTREMRLSAMMGLMFMSSRDKSLASGAATPIWGHTQEYLPYSSGTPADPAFVGSSRLADQFRYNNLDPNRSQTFPLRSHWSSGKVKYAMQHTAAGSALGTNFPANFDEPVIGSGAAMSTRAYSLINLPDVYYDGQLTLSVPDNQPYYGPIHSD